MDGVRVALDPAAQAKVAFTRYRRGSAGTVLSRHAWVSVGPVHAYFCRRDHACTRRRL